MTACIGQALSMREQPNSTDVLLLQSKTDQSKDSGADSDAGAAGGVTVSRAKEFDALTKICILGVLLFLTFQVLF